MSYMLFRRRLTVFCVGETDVSGLLAKRFCEIVKNSDENECFWHRHRPRMDGGCNKQRENPFKRE
jgi:hypothetical protein